MILNFQRKKLHDFFFKRLSLPKIKHIAKRLLSKLKILHRECSWQGLKNFFQTDLEEMKGNWKEWCSIRINDQYRIIFKWGQDNNAYEVDLTKHYQKANL
jgi:proteic killer suppression protein